MNFSGFRRRGCCEKFVRRAGSIRRPRCSSTIVAADAPGLAEIVGRHHHLDAARGDRAHDVLDRLGGGGIETRGRLVEKQHLRIARQRAGEREPLLFAARQPPRRTRCETVKADQGQQFGDARCAVLASARPLAPAHNATLAAVVLRSITGRWNTIARRVGGDQRGRPR